MKSIVNSLRQTARAGIFMACIAAAALAAAQTNPYAKGPDPTKAALEADLGSFAVATTSISRAKASGFGGGTVYYPTAAGSYGAISISPGYTATQVNIAWLGPRLASRGFVVITIDTFTTSDLPASRALQLKAALNQVVTMSQTAGNVINGKVDANRLAVAGDSLGGGGALLAGLNNPTLKATVGLVPYSYTQNFATQGVPTLMIGGKLDTTAVPAQHAIAFYNSIPGTTYKAYMELATGDHYLPHRTNFYPIIGRYMVSWYKRFVDNDTRYSPYLCGTYQQADAANTALVSKYLQNCPY